MYPHIKFVGHVLYLCTNIYALSMYPPIKFVGHTLYLCINTYTLSMYPPIKFVVHVLYLFTNTCTLSMYPLLISLDVYSISIPIYIYSTYVTPYQVRGTYTLSRTYIYTLPTHSPIKFVGHKLYLCTCEYMERPPHENNFIFFHSSLVCTGWWRRLIIMGHFPQKSSAKEAYNYWLFCGESLAT